MILIHYIRRNWRVYYKVMVENFELYCKKNGFAYEIKDGDNGVKTMVVDAVNITVHIGEKGVGIESSSNVKKED